MLFTPNEIVMNKCVVENTIIIQRKFHVLMYLLESLNLLIL